MKNFVCLLVFLFSQQIFACSCTDVSVLERATSADFIATVKILKLYTDENNSNLHNVDIEILNLYKGNNVSTLKIISVKNNSCSFWTPENSEWLIFANKDKNGILYYGFCSGSKKIDS